MDISDIDIMRPKLTRIGNMCFRRLDVPNDGVIDDFNDNEFSRQNVSTKVIDDNVDQNSDKQNSDQNPTKDKLKSIDELEDSESKSTEDIKDIEDISGGKGSRFRGQLDVSKYFHKFIIGQKGNQKREIESESGCRISVPEVTDLSGYVVITGNTHLDVKYAINRIDDIVKRARNRSDFTHFLSIPFNDKSICERFMTFKEQILNDSQINVGIDDSLFQNSHKLHLTVVPLLLTDQKEKKIASQILDDCHNKYIKHLTNGQPLRVKLEGIDYMNDDPTQVNVVYANVVDMSDKKCLQSIVDDLFDRFQESGLIRDKHQFDRMNAESKVKLHVTLMNTSFRRKEMDRIKGPTDRTANSFNAEGVLNKFKNYYFGQIIVQTIEISIRHSNHGKDGYYSHISRIEL